MRHVYCNLCSCIIIQDIQAEAEKAGKLLADIFKLIESCCRDLGKRAAILELLNEMIREREPERLVQVEAIREQVTRYNVLGLAETRLPWQESSQRCKDWWTSIWRT
jgi:hypothetical protein